METTASPCGRGGRGHSRFSGWGTGAGTHFWKVVTWLHGYKVTWLEFTTNGRRSSLSRGERARVRGKKLLANQMVKCASVQRKLSFSEVSPLPPHVTM